MARCPVIWIPIIPINLKITIMLSNYPLCLIQMLFVFGNKQTEKDLKYNVNMLILKVINLN